MAKTKRMKSPWQKHVNETMGAYKRENNGKVDLKAVLKRASKTYKKSKLKGGGLNLKEKANSTFHAITDKFFGKSEQKQQPEELVQSPVKLPPTLPPAGGKKSRKSRRSKRSKTSKR